MQKPFTTQPEFFVSASDIDHPILRSFDDTEVLLDWSQIEKPL
jgi:IS5 family transposase